MQRSPRPPRTPSNVSDSVQQRLNMYALAAGAAGVSMLALSQPAEARIVYTKAHVWIGVKHLVLLDLSHDGNPDFTLYQGASTDSTLYNWRLSVRPRRTNAVWPASSNGKTNYYASALPPGVQLGPKSPFVSGAKVMQNGLALRHETSSGVCYGRWNNVKNRYLGLKFVIKGRTHFGWARLNVGCSLGHHKATAWLTGYAYETIPNKPIITGKTKGPADDPTNGLDFANPDDPSSGASLANPIPDKPQPATLGLLAMGSPGLSVWRREESVAATPESN